MDINKIHYFFQAAELKNFTKAAENCNIAQTTISKYISVLEEELGTKLFAREGRNVRLTSEGELFYSGMKKIEQQYRGLCRQIAQSGQKELRIGMVTSDYADFDILHSFEQEHPDISVYYSFAGEKKLLADLKAHRLEAIITPDFIGERLPETEDMASVGLLRIKETVTCSKELLDKYGSLQQVIANMPMITKTDNAELHSLWKSQFRRLYGVEFPEATAVDSFPQQMLLLNLSRGFAVIPQGRGSAYQNLVSFNTDEELDEVEIMLWLKDNMSPALRMLTEYIYEKK
jgi:DNA-binding transcriptional LysR family regulator